jgi:hypothetical protein
MSATPQLVQGGQGREDTEVCLAAAVCFLCLLGFVLVVIVEVLPWL